MSIEVRAVSDAIGAEISGVALIQDISNVDFRMILEAWHDHLVLLFRGQTLSDERLVNFSKRFGTLDLAPPGEAYNTGTNSVPGMPEITVLSNVVENGVPIGALGNSECVWHTDMTYADEPPSACLLYGIEVPSEGGMTGVANMYLAYDSLSDDLKRKIEPMEAIHDNTYTSAGTLRKGFKPVDDVRNAPSARHPLVRTHPDTGRRSLFLGRRQNQYILGLGVDESEAILDELWEHATREAFAWHHRWEIGDLLIWDNRCTMHRRDSFPSNARRILHRTQVQGRSLRLPETPSDISHLDFKAGLLQGVLNS